MEGADTLRKREREKKVFPYPRLNALVHFNIPFSISCCCPPLTVVVLSGKTTAGVSLSAHLIQPGIMKKRKETIWGDCNSYRFAVVSLKDLRGRERQSSSSLLGVFSLKKKLVIGLKVKKKTSGRRRDERERGGILYAGNYVGYYFIIYIDSSLKRTSKRGPADGRPLVNKSVWYRREREGSCSWRRPSFLSSAQHSSRRRFPNQSSG